MKTENTTPNQHKKDHSQCGCGVLQKKIKTLEEEIKKLNPDFILSSLFDLQKVLET